MKSHNDSNDCVPAVASAKAGVYFDDMKVTHTKSNILQYNACLPKLQRRQEYYPFGLQTASSWTREGSSNNYLYNEASELNQNSGWYETFFRGYDPTLGRFHQVDPLAHASSSHTPYNYAYNDPVFYNDPNGDYPREVLLDMERYGVSGQAVHSFGEGGLLPGQAGGYSYYHPSQMSNGGWMTQYGDVNRNASVMSTAQFNSYYRINDSNREDFANNISINVYNGKELFNPWIGDEVGHNMFTGGWMSATGADALSLIANMGNNFITRVAQQAGPGPVIPLGAWVDPSPTTSRR